MMRGDRQFIPSNTPASGVKTWEISPCLEFADVDDGQPSTEAFATVDEAEAMSDEANGPLFWGVYINVREDYISDLLPPSVHIKDFQCHADAMEFVRAINGKESE